MTMAYGEKMLRNSGDPRDQVYADMLAAILELRGEDVQFPGDVDVATELAAAPSEVANNDDAGVSTDETETALKAHSTTVGLLALTTELIERPTSFDELDEGIRRRNVVAEAGATITRGYLDAIGANLVGAPEVRGIRQRANPTRELHYKQQTLKSMPPHDAIYQLDTVYRRQESASGGDTIKTAYAFAAIVQRRDRAAGQLKLDFPDNQLRTVHVGWGNGYKLFPGDFLGDNDALMGLIRRDIKQYVGSVDLGLAYDNLFIKTQDPWSYVSNTYAYDPKTDCFMHTASAGEEREGHGQPITVAAYLEMVQSSLTLLPAEQLALD
jgi:hypothetical protein